MNIKDKIKHIKFQRILQKDIFLFKFLMDWYKFDIDRITGKSKHTANISYVGGKILKLPHGDDPATLKKEIYKEINEHFQESYGMFVEVYIDNEDILSIKLIK